MDNWIDIPVGATTKEYVKALYSDKRETKGDTTMKLEFEEDEVFLYNVNNLSIVAVGMTRGHETTIIIKFNSLKQMRHFKEMIELIEEKLKEIL